MEEEPKRMFLRRCDTLQWKVLDGDETLSSRESCSQCRKGNGRTERRTQAILSEVESNMKEDSG